MARTRLDRSLFRIEPLHIADAEGVVIDPTADQFRSRPDYSAGRGNGFLTRAPSKRARELMTAANLPQRGPERQPGPLEAAALR